MNIKEIDNKVIKKTLLETMEQFHNFCEQNNLKYFMVGGTLLGAVRHKGFIPWDDDIDVSMPKCDYEKLLKMSDKFNYPFLLKHFKIDGKHIYPNIQLINNNIIIEEDFYKSFPNGLWIDVFPLDYSFESNIAKKIQYGILRFLRNLLIIRVGSFKKKNKGAFTYNFIKFNHYLFRIIPISFFNNIRYLFEKLFNTISKKEYITNTYGAYGIREVSPKYIFSDRILLEFENRKYWAPKEYDLYLKKIYGDYMVLPDESKRIGNHIHKIISINDESL
ncbi:LicD family protein [Aliarcobacter thereius]|uniref:LicD family protein n=1 Tax=Aliarcobacter thereius LMG 24486 TaxID=1032240 RepID=A0A1C7WSW1_9BACT|nr:LicD family protein [Aliarcobacter thereius]OCL95927.1 LicD family protein [Aliarcobacter thereius LMG 24486]QBF16101.1 LicD family protein [Aliarcobacter thereius LMG 24486]TLS94560.1 LicD family protein [Aliarcobacter thereius]